MGIYYHSTRNKDKHYTASQAILKGLADDGGLFVRFSSFLGTIVTQNGDFMQRWL